MKTLPLSAISALVGILVTIIPAAMWVGSLQRQVRDLEVQVSQCASKEIQQAHDSWIRGWSEELNYRLRRLEEKK